MLTIPNIHETPPGGWKYTSEHGVKFPTRDGGMVYAFDVLVKQITDHRKATGGDLEVGWLERFIDELCRQNPEYRCMEELPYSDRKIGLPELKRFVFTVKNFIESGGKLVSREKANERAAICARCPRNIDIGGCLGCTKLGEYVLNLIPSSKTDHDLQLRSCGVCGCILKSKVWLPAEVMSNEGIDDSDFPEFCWIPKEKANETKS